MSVHPNASTSLAQPTTLDDFVVFADEDGDDGIRRVPHSMTEATIETQRQEPRAHWPGTSIAVDESRLGSAAPRATDDVQETADILFRLLIDEGAGCSEEKHGRDHDLHLGQQVDNHNPLSVTYEPPSELPSVIRAETGLRSRIFPGNQGMARRAYPSEEAMRRRFEGTLHPKNPVRNVCLHTEKTPEAAPIRTFDIDSLLVFPRSFAAFKTGFRYCPAKQVSWNIQTNLHVERDVMYVDGDGKERRERRSLQDIPHLYLGAIDGFQNNTLHIFFPRLIRKGQRFTYLTQPQVTNFIDNAMWPACHAYLEDDRVQYFPPTQQVAELNARAKGVEHQQHDRERGLKQFQYYRIKHENLSPICQLLRSRIDDASNGLGAFEDFFLFVDVKGVKIDFKISGSLHDSLDDFEQHLARVFDLDLIDEIYQDIGREVCPPQPCLPPTSMYDEGKAMTYLWRTCCLQQQREHLVEGAFDGMRGNATFYHLGFLRDAAGMTLVPPKRSLARRGGWMYGQWYSCVKRIGDAMSTYPFDNKDLQELAVDAGVWKAHAHSGKSTRHRSREYLVRSYCGSKGRVSGCYPQSQHTSFGVRTEFRVNRALFLAIKQLAAEWEGERELPVRLMSHPRSVWPVMTQNYTEFMLGNYEKFTSALEIVSLTSARTGVTVERSRVMMVLLKCLQEFASSDLTRHPALLYDEHERQGRRRRGLGFQRTVRDFGFGWLNPVVDWERFQFRAEVAAEMVDADRGLVQWYSYAGRLIQDLNQMLDLCCERLAKPLIPVVALDELLRLAAHVCLRQYRRDALTLLEKEMVRSLKTDEDKDSVQFCAEGLQEAFGMDLKFVKGNRTAVKSPAFFVEWLWLSTDLSTRKERLKRTHFENKPYRGMFGRVSTAVEGRTQLEERWLAIFMGEFCAYHWVCPYPDPSGTLIATAKETRDRQWWALDKDSTGKEWAWAKESARPGRPGPYPAALQLSAAAFAAHLDQMGSTVGEDGGAGP